MKITFVQNGEVIYKDARFELNIEAGDLLDLIKQIIDEETKRSLARIERDMKQAEMQKAEAEARKAEAKREGLSDKFVDGFIKKSDELAKKAEDIAAKAGNPKSNDVW